MRSPAQLGLVEELLLRLRIFQQMEKGLDACRELSRAVTVVDLHLGDIIFEEGDVGDAFYIVLKGAVAVSRREEGLNVGENLCAHTNTNRLFLRYCNRVGIEIYI